MRDSGILKHETLRSLLALIAAAISFVGASNVSSAFSPPPALDTASYTITAGAGTHGTVIPSGVVSVLSGGNFKFRIVPETNYKVQDVLVDGVSLGPLPSYTFTNVTANHTLTVSFTIKTFTIKSSAWSNGTISPNGSITVNYGAQPKYTITPNEGYDVADVKVNSVSKGPLKRYTFDPISANATIVASFKRAQCALKASAGLNGSISPSGTLQVDYGSRQEYTIKPALGYHVDNIMVDGLAQGPMTKFTFNYITTGHTIRATFARNTIRSYLVGSYGIPAGDWSILTNAGMNTLWVRPTSLEQARAYPQMKKIYSFGINCDNDVIDWTKLREQYNIYQSAGRCLWVLPL